MLPNSLPQGLYSFTLSAAVTENACFSILDNKIKLLDFCSSYRQETISQCSVNLFFSDFKWGWNQCVKASCMSIFMNCLSESFAYFSSSVFIFSLGFLIVLYKLGLLYTFTHVENVFPPICHVSFGFSYSDFCMQEIFVLVVKYTHLFLYCTRILESVWKHFSVPRL